MKTVLVGMSGGVDSTAAVLLLKEAGYEVHGLTLYLHGDEESAKEAARLAASLSVPHTVLDMRAVFHEKVQKPFADAYLKGNTPNPCVNCNRDIKFASLLQFADAHGIPYIATGHYASIENKDGKSFFVKGKDAKKDQTYFLSQVPPSILPRLVLPLGGYTKDEVRAIAARAGLAVAQKADSQEICFVPGNDYIAYLEKNIPNPGTEGKILDENGFMVGIHSGIYRYTVGQRKGLGAFGKKVFVTSIDAANNTVSIGENDALFSGGLLAGTVNAFDLLSGNVSVKIRSSAPAVPATCRQSGNEVEITFSEPQRAVTPGQTVAIYRDDFLIGGATIKRQI